MASTINLRVEVTITDEDADADAVPEQLVIEKELTALTNVVRRRVPVADAATATLWDPGTLSDVGSFSFLLVASDVQVELELNAGSGDADENRFVATIAPDAPLILAADDSRLREAGDNGFAGTADVIDKLRVKNSSGSAAKVDLILAA